MIDVGWSGSIGPPFGRGEAGAEGGFDRGNELFWR